MYLLRISKKNFKMQTFSFLYKRHYFVNKWRFYCF